MSSKILEKMFGGENRLKIIKLFIFNSDIDFDKEEISKKLRIKIDSIQKELDFLREIKIIKNTYSKREIKTKKGPILKKIKTFSLNKNFPYLNSLKSLLINTIPSQKTEIVKKLSKCGNLKIIIITGIFLQVEESIIDLLIVADNVREGMVKNVIAQIEADIGKEIRYTVFSSQDFKYRLGLYDHLMKNVFDYPHQILVDKIGI
ncbi:MAG TPA: hypothetical protein PJ997_02200 [Candidatus Paceibacterota bacterium]|nr:hypothetical protein [Candidatus Paceibacterota bacterium]HMP19127.1 hypothetical protein [Candidatus Paceibacterota bacterium]HMP85604.1 hypothetical protein [Candidatus Paceibacterota bacterium]